MLKRIFCAIPALLLAVFIALPLMSGRASAVTLNYGDMAALSSCTPTDPCDFNTATINVGYFSGVFDHFYATLTGTPGQTLNWQMTAGVDMQVVTSGVGGVPLTTTGGGGSAVHNLLAGVMQVIPFQFGADGMLTINTVTPTGAVTSNGELFAENAGGLVTGVDATGGFFFTDTSTACVTHGVCTTGGGGSGTGGGTSVVPVPPAAALLPAGLLIMGLCGRRRKTAAA